MTPLGRGIISSGKLGASESSPFSVNSAATNGGSRYFTTTSQVLTTTSDWSFAGWIKLDTITGNNTMVSDFDVDSGLMIRYRDASNAVRLTANDGVLLLDSTFGALSTGVFYFVAATYNTITGYSLTVNATRDTDVSTSANQVSRKFHFGRLSPSVASQGIDGSMGLYMAYDRTLSESDITEIYNLGTPKCHAGLSPALLTNLAGFWDMGNWTAHTGSELVDRSVNSNTLINVGSTPFTGTGLTVEC